MIGGYGREGRAWVVAPSVDGDLQRTVAHRARIVGSLPQSDLCLPWPDVAGPLGRRPRATESPSRESEVSLTRNSLADQRGYHAM